MSELPRQAEATANKPEESSRLGAWLKCLLILLALVGLAAVLSKAHENDLSHDEVQFVSPGLLTIQHGLIPYRDYPLFHVPNLVLLHGLIAHVFTYKLLALRIFTAFAMWLTAVLLARWTWSQLSGLRPGLRATVACSIGALLILSPIFAFTAQFIWNHGTPTLFVLAALLLHLKALANDSPGKLLFSSGLLIGLAAGMRLSIVPLLAPFGAALVLLGTCWTWKQRLSAMAWFSAGSLLAMSPCLYLLARYPEQFFYDNFTYPHVSLVWREFPFWRKDIASFVDPQHGFIATNHPGFAGVPLSKKFGALFSEAVRKNLPAFGLMIFSLIAGILVPGRPVLRSKPIGFALLCLPFVLWGAFAPARANPQYYYILVVFGLLLAVPGLAALLNSPNSRPWTAALCFLCLAAALPSGIKQYPEFKKSLRLHKWRDWKEVREHEKALHLRQKLADRAPGPVLGMAALHIQEAGLEIYPEFSSDQFPWRMAHLLPSEKRGRLRIIGPGDLETFLANTPPAAIVLSDPGSKIEAPLIEYANQHGYRPDPQRPRILLPAK